MKWDLDKWSEEKDLYECSITIVVFYHERICTWLCLELIPHKLCVIICAVYTDIVLK